MARVTKIMKEKIISNLFEDIIRDRVDELREMESDLADRVYEEVFGTHLATMKKLPANYFPTTATIRVSVGAPSKPDDAEELEAWKAGRWYYSYSMRRSLPSGARSLDNLSFGTTSKLDFRDNEERIVPEFAEYGGVVIPKRGQLYKDLMHYEEETFKLAAATVTTCLEARKALDSFTTTTRLLEAWPEVEQYLPEGWDKVQTSKAVKEKLSVPSEALNAAISCAKKGRECNDNTASV